MKDPMNLIRRTIQILDTPRYAHYSNSKANSYLDYFESSWPDEDRLIAPVLLLEFLKDVLGFKVGQTISAKEPTQTGRPDFVPTDLRTHPFVFEAKGSDSHDLSQHYNEKRKYLEIHGVQYLVITNMRDLEVYTLTGPRKLEEYSFSFLQLYNNFKTDSTDILEKENTKRFLRFVEHFSFKELTLEEKLKRVIQAKPWRGDEELDVELLTNRLRAIVELLFQDVKARHDEIADFTASDPERAEAIAKEVEWIASEVSPAHKPQEVSARTLQEILQAKPTDLYGRALDVFFYRVAYFTMTRILLARTWEDIGFIDQALYDGGLEKFYENSNREIRHVLKWAFQLAAERYEWLFNVQNNYSWYEPSTDVLIEVLYELSNFNLGKLNQDVLGTIYEEYIDRMDKKNKGQYYTPREIVSFIWDRVGFNNPKAFFDYEKGQRKPKPIFDPATGSGGFLVEAARRLREESQLDLNDKQNVLDVRTAIFSGLFGAEISPFPYYITEVNLLIQLTPVIQRLMELQPALKKEHLPLAVVLVDALSLHNDHRLIADQADEYKPDPLRSILPLDRRKKVIFDKIKNELARGFAYCCANPPYIGEKGHKDLFRSTRERYPYWQTYYQGKMDYLYWFIILGLSKLREGGRLGFITTAYWPTADGAAKLRKYILENAKILELIFFEDVKIFEHAKGQHNMVFVLERCSDAKERGKNRIKLVRVIAKHNELPGETTREKLRFLTDHIRKHIDKNKREDQYIKVFWSSVKQGELPQDGGSWANLLVKPSAHSFINQLEQKGEELKQLCRIEQGIVSGADQVTKSNIKLLPEWKIKQHNIQIGDGIFVITQAEKQALGLPSQEEVLVKPTYKNSDICLYFVSPGDEELYIIYMTKNTDLKAYPKLAAHLEKFKEILEQKRECKEGKLPWYSLHWARDENLLSATKIATSRWGEGELKPFGLQTGTFYENSDINFIVPKANTTENLLYVLGVLNSELIKRWMTEKGRQWGLTRQKMLEQIPIRRIDFSNPQDVRCHNTIVQKVKSIRKELEKLAEFSKYFDGPRLPQLEFDAPLPPLKMEAVLQELPPEMLYSLPTHPDIKILKSKSLRDEDFQLRRIGKVEQTLEGPQLKLTSKDRQALTLAGPEPLLKLVSELLKPRKGQAWEQIKEEILLPKTIKLLQHQSEEILEKVKQLRKKILGLQKEIDEIVYSLYGLKSA